MTPAPATRRKAPGTSRSHGARDARPSAHFTPELFRFMRQLRRNNDREWFQKNRDRYIEHVRDPMVRFIGDFAPRLRRISRQFLADPSLQGGSMFRIHRDVRFSNDKSPYKTMAAAQFRHLRGKDVHAPGFYLHLGAGEVFTGGGLWRPDGPTLSAIRTHLVEHGDDWKRLLRRQAFRDGRLRLGGESLKRPPRGFDPEHPLIDDLKRKDFIVATDLGEEDACAPDFLDRYTEICRTQAPFVRFLTDATGLPW
ncbi:MAG: DUF2461 domain-containing protein [Planctomycetota bacterium]|jgi:uncharacterized protein (TIGR02453 family)